jgi:hypothetical protein
MTRPGPEGRRAGAAFAEPVASAEALYVVRVHDHVDARIAGHDGCAYASPPAPRDSAMALVGLLLGGDPRAVNGGGAWTRAVPGGRRTITLVPAPDRTR